MKTADIIMEYFGYQDAGISHDDIDARLEKHNICEKVSDAQFEQIHKRLNSKAFMKEATGGFDEEFEKQLFNMK